MRSSSFLTEYNAQLPASQSQAWQLALLSQPSQWQMSVRYLTYSRRHSTLWRYVLHLTDCLASKHIVSLVSLTVSSQSECVEAVRPQCVSWGTLNLHTKLHHIVLLSALYRVAPNTQLDWGREGALIKSINSLFSSPPPPHLSPFIL